MDSIEPNDWVEYYSESRQINCWSSKSRNVTYPAATRNQVELFQVGWVMFPDESFYNVFTGATTSDITLLDQYVHPAVNDSNSSDPSVQIGRSDNKVTGEVVVLENKSSPAWKCKWCQADNNGKHLACKLCGQPKGVQAQNSQPKQCAWCTFDNPSTAVKCETCERPLSVSASDGWMCGGCTFENTDDRTNCGMCNMLRSGGGEFAQAMARARRRSNGNMSESVAATLATNDDNDDDKTTTTTAPTITKTIKKSQTPRKNEIPKNEVMKTNEYKTSSNDGTVFTLPSVK